MEKSFLMSFMLTIAVAFAISAAPSSKTSASGAADDKARKVAAERGLTLLAQKVNDGTLTHPSGDTGCCVVYSTAGLAFLAEGSTLSAGKYKGELEKCYKYIQTTLEKCSDSVMGDQWDQSMWAYSHALIFLTELHAGAPDETKAEIFKLAQTAADVLVKAQTPEGGWCHGAKNIKNALGYTSFVGVSNFCLIALGCSSKIKAKVPAATIDNGIKYIENSSSDGQVGYSPREGQKGFGQAGRNAGSVLAFMACKKSGNKNFRKMVSFMEDNMSEIPKGHGSAQMHVMLTDWATYVLGTKNWTAFWKMHGKGILALQKEDGNFDVEIGDEAAKMGGAVGSAVEGGDRALATHVFILLIPQSKFKNLTFK